MEVISVRPYEYSTEIALTIGDMVREGITLTKICASENMPTYQTLMKWRRSYPEMESILVQSRRARAEFFHGIATETLLELRSEYEPSMMALGRARAVMEYGLKLAEIDNPSEYGKKAEDHSTNQTVIIVTGVPQKSEQGVIDYEQIFERKRSLGDSSKPGTSGRIYGTTEATTEGADSGSDGPGLPDDI